MSSAAQTVDPAAAGTSAAAVDAAPASAAPRPAALIQDYMLDERPLNEEEVTLLELAEGALADVTTRRSYILARGKFPGQRPVTLAEAWELISGT
jgi:hypothetical protein